VFITKYFFFNFKYVQTVSKINYIQNNILNNI
jgi:hypothetical protein